MEKGADISADSMYRYSLWRIWQPAKPMAMFIGLNPSTADATRDDPTIRRCLRFSGDWGCGGLVMTNLFAFRATSPKVMLTAPEPIGSQNDRVLEDWGQKVGLIVAVWGTMGGHQGRDKVIEAQFPELRCLGVTKAGFPRHPARLHSNTQLISYSNLIWSKSLIDKNN